MASGFSDSAIVEFLNADTRIFDDLRSLSDIHRTPSKSSNDIR